MNPISARKLWLLLRKAVAKLTGRTSPSLYWDLKYETEEFIYTKTANRFVVELCSDLAAGTAIDLAGGEGRNTVWLAERGWRVEDVDLSATGLKKAQAFAKERNVSSLVSTLCASGADFKSNVAPADLGLIGYLQVPNELLKASMKNLVSQLKPGANLVGVWHARENLGVGFGGPQDPEVLPSVETMTKICAQLPVNVNSLELRDGQVQTKEGLKPSITLLLSATVKS
jgi:SAM-dependent methyltransferase